MNIFYLSITVWLNIIVGSNEVTLTTMVTRPSVWPKPTSSLQAFSPEKISNLEENTATDSLNTTDDAALLDNNITDEKLTNLVSEIRGYSGTRRSGGGNTTRRNNIKWGWDKWCQFQPKTGNCHQEKVFFFYQAQTDTCREFTYTGCKGNENRFATKQDCERFCKGFGTAIETKTLTQLDACSLQPDPGNCLAFMPRYYYDVNNAKCRKFVFGGCGGNDNRFTDRDECLKKCDGRNPT